MAKRDFSGVSNYQVIIPYKDLVKFCELATQMDEMEKLIKRIDERSSALQSMYTELLEKIQEMDRYL